MTHDPFNKLFGRRRGLNRIDKQCLLACIPDELSLGLTEDEIHKAYGERCGPLFHIEDFREALRQLVGTDVRTTDRKNVPLYRRTHPRSVDSTRSRIVRRPPLGVQ